MWSTSTAHSTARHSAIGVPARETPVARTDRTLEVRLAAPLGAMATPGGGETQLLQTRRALEQLGVHAELWRPWEHGFSGFDCLHLFGSTPEHLDVVQAAQARGVKVALSTIAWFDLPALWNSGESLTRRSWSVGKFVARAALPRLTSWRRKLYHAADLLLPNSEAEADQLVRYFQVPRSRIQVVPNAASSRFAQSEPAWLPPEWNLPDEFVLYPGRIEPRKNQLGFLQAMRGSTLPVVIMGSVVPGFETYAEQCHREAAGRQIVFLPPVPHGDRRLAGAYASCRCLALTSWFETPGLVALEAGMHGTPLALTDRGATREYFGQLAHYANPASSRSIRNAVDAAWQQPRSAELAAHVQQHFTWEAVARSTIRAYARMTEPDPLLRLACSH